ncbi:MAG: hypothetical protein SNJ29_14560 [Rikenellaceae bacterium]
MSDLEDVDWFALRVRFQRAEIVTKERLNKPDIEVYLPMEMRAIPTKGGGECIKLAPILSDMIFLKTTFRRVSEICAAYKDMYYRSEVRDGFKRAIRIPEDQMTTFKEFIAGNYDNLDCKMTQLKSGKKVVVKSGMFKGSKVLFKEEKGKIKKEYKIEINGIDWKFSEEGFTEKLLSRI